MQHSCSGYLMKFPSLLPSVCDLSAHPPSLALLVPLRPLQWLTHGAPRLRGTSSWCEMQVVKEPPLFSGMGLARFRGLESRHISILSSINPLPMEEPGSCLHPCNSVCQTLGSSCVSLMQISLRRLVCAGREQNLRSSHPNQSPLKSG